MIWPLYIALLFVPFEFKTPAGFHVEHNGAQASLAMIDEAYARFAEKQHRACERELVEIVRVICNRVVDDLPTISRIVHRDVHTWDTTCLPEVRVAAARSCGGCRTVMVVNAGTPEDELPATFDAGFLMLWRAVWQGISTWQGTSACAMREGGEHGEAE